MNLFELCMADGDANLESASLTVRDPDGTSFEKIAFPGVYLHGAKAQAVRRKQLGRLTLIYTSWMRIALSKA